MKFVRIFLQVSLIVGLIVSSCTLSFAADKPQTKIVHHKKITKGARPIKVTHHSIKIKDNRKVKAERQMRRYKQRLLRASTTNAVTKTRFIPSGAKISSKQRAFKPASSYFFDDMENGTGSWTIDTPSDTLWHLTESNYNSPSHSWWLGNESTGTYNNGSRVNQSLISQTIDLTNINAPLALSFYEYYVTEAGKDICMIEVSTDAGVSWSSLRDSVSGDSYGWINSSVNLNNFAGQQIKIRFHFDTGDSLYNDFPGWFIDDVSLIGDPGIIWGNVFLDMNQNQMEDGNDPGLAGWIVTATASGMTTSTVTDNQGNYQFTLPADTYIIAESLQTGWIQTAPSSGTYTFSITTSGQSFIGSFGNWHPNRSLNGYVFADDNRNTVQDSGELLIPNQFIYLETNTGWMDNYIQTDSTGHFSFTVIDTAIYTIYQGLDQELDGYWDIQTWPLNGASYTFHIENFTDTVPVLRFGTFYPARHPWIISGFIFHDDNMNGIQDSNETGYQNQYVDIEGGNNNYSSDEVCTDSTGHFYDAVYDTGSFDITQELSRNQTQTLPPDGKNYTIHIKLSSDTISSLLFGTTYTTLRNPVKISGFVFTDENKNGVQDTNETGAIGQNIVLEGEDNNWNDDEEGTDKNGYFSFWVENPGVYDIYQDLDEDNSTQTFPPNHHGYSVQVTIATDSISGLRFGTFYDDLVECRISGVVFNDINKNSILDSGEVGCPNIDLLLGGRYEYSMITTTDSNGRYSFKGLPTGHYTVTVHPRSDQDWIPSSTPVSYTFDFPVQTWIGNANFGVTIIHPTASMAGNVFNDTNYNSVKDQGEPGLSSWSISLTGYTVKGSPVSTSTLSDTNGNYVIGGLWPGTYTVTEEIRSLWVQTCPPNFRGYTITLNPESTVTHFDFGNHLDSSFVTAYRSFLPEDLEYTRDIKGNLKWTPIKKLYPTKVGFACAFGNGDRSGRVATSLQMQFSLPVIDYLNVYPGGSQIFSGNKSVVITFPMGIVPGDSVHISGIARELVAGKTDKQKFISPRWTFSDNSSSSAYAKSIQWKYVEYIPPNAVDVLMAMTGHPVQVGNVTTHSILMKKYLDIGKSLIDHSTIHKGPPTCLGYYKSGYIINKQQFSLSPKYDAANNKLFSEAIALRVNIMASDSNITPPGLGDLIYNEGGDNPLNGKSIRFIADLLDTYMSSNDYLPPYHDYTNKTQCHIPAGYEWLDSMKLWQTVRNIDSAFSGPIDVYYWYPGTIPKMSLTPVRSIKAISYLHIDSSFAQIGKMRPVAKSPVQIPDRFALSQNYPNPFNPSTTIQFSLPEPSIVTVTIYNILGQDVVTLLNRQTFDAGYQNVDFDATGLASGVYFYRIVAERVDDNGAATGQNFTQVKKMVLMR